ncbi:hypothetical protein AAVH_17266 [Aphelenchoides avenae]|nr:hypothetical protein AAVH_17266 [Aphelenchus avenae]
MLRELIDESLQWCTRDELELIQPSSRVLHEMIVARSALLPRRTLGHVDMGCRWERKIKLERIPYWLKEYRGKEYRGALEDMHPPDFEFSLRHGDSDATSDCSSTPASGPFVQQFMANALDMDIVVGNIDFRVHPDKKAEGLALRDTVVNLLRPRFHSTEGEGGRRRHWR